MITEIEVSNYRSLGPSVRLRLGELTALVGPNGAGKSNLADVFRFVAEALTVGLEAAIASRHGIDAVRRWSSGRPFNLGIRLSLHEEAFSGSFQFTLAGDSAEDYRVKEEEALVVDQKTGTTQKYRLRDCQWAEGPADLRPKVTKQSLALTLVGIEEPELTVHVGAIPLLYDYLKQAARRGQVLLTTHSIELLERLDIDDIRLVDRRQGVTSVAPVRQDQRDAIKKRLLTVGDVVSMEGLQPELQIGDEVGTEA